MKVRKEQPALYARPRLGRSASRLSPPASQDFQWQRTPAAASPYRAWLTDRGSLTARIAARCSGLRVEVTFQGLRRPDRDERFLFADAGRSRVLVREVLLCCGDTPLVFAHTVVRPRDLAGPWRSVACLGSRPLGAALFADPRIERFPLRQRKLGPHHELARRVRTVLHIRQTARGRAGRYFAWMIRLYS